jgi:dolichyl-diphosphooligosaccharide--protein glycosyltransferase
VQAVPAPPSVASTADVEVVVPPKTAWPLPSIPTSTIDNTQSLLRFVILAFITGAAVASRLFAVIRFESVIHEFDPWFN